MRKVYRITESKLINIIQKSLIKEDNSRQNIKNIQSALKAKGKPYSTLLGTSGPNRDGVDGVFGPSTENAIKQFQKDNGLEQVGYVGPKTANLLGVKKMDGPVSTGGSSTTTNDKTTTTTTEDDTNCIGPTEVCQKSTSKRETKPAAAGTDGCAKWARQQLEKKGVGISGNAWEWAGRLKSGLKYNMYTDGVNWNNIYSQMKSNGINMSVCGECLQDNADSKIGKCAKLGSIIANSMPSSSSVNTGDLKVGDAVGMYHSSSDNKSFAFCTKALGKSVPKDSTGYLQPSSSDHFTFNSHVGYVGAIKNGVPIIFHNVHGTVHATPATNLMSKSNSDMISWVASTSASSSTPTSKSGTQSAMDRYLSNPYAKRRGGGLD